MNRRRFINTAMRAAAALPIFGPLMRGQNVQRTSATFAEIGVVDGPPPPFVVPGYLNSIDVLGEDGNWVTVMSNARASRIADEHLERYAQPVVTFEVDGEVVDAELLAELEARARRRVDG